MFTIYGLLTSDEGIRYVGQTRAPLVQRLRQHLNATAPLPRNAWIQQQVRNGVEIELVRLESGLTAEEGNDAERDWIRWFREFGVELVNRTPGGEGFNKYRMTSEHKDAVRASGRSRRGRLVSDATRLKLHRSHLGQRPTGIGARGRLARAGESNPMHDPAAVAKMRASLTGRRLSEAHRETLRRAQQERRRREKEEKPRVA